MPPLRQRRNETKTIKLHTAQDGYPVLFFYARFFIFYLNSL